MEESDGVAAEREMQDMQDGDGVAANSCVFDRLAGNIRWVEPQFDDRHCICVCSEPGQNNTCPREQRQKISLRASPVKDQMMKRRREIKPSTRYFLFRGYKTHHTFSIGCV
jgi:hypothetical protein